MNAFIDRPQQDNHGGHLRVLRAASVFLLVAVLAVSLAACEKKGRPSATREDFVGIWACFKSKVDNQEEFRKKGEGLNQFLIIMKDGTAWEAVTTDGANPVGMEYQWHMTLEDKRTGEDSGIVLVNDQYTNPYTYYEADAQRMEPHFVDKRLVRGNLAIDYGHRVDYYEKVSDDPYDPAWVPSAGKNADPAAKAPAIPNEAIEWTEAPAHIGETVTVRGPVKDSSFISESNGQPTYINIGAAYPDPSRVSVVVWGEDRGNFPGDPEGMYLGKTICVTGELYAYDNATYVKVAMPDQITVLD